MRYVLQHVSLIRTTEIKIKIQPIHCYFQNKLSDLCKYLTYKILLMQRKATAFVPSREDGAYLSDMLILQLGQVCVR